MAVVLDASALVLALAQRGKGASTLRHRLQAEFCHAPHLVDAEVGHALRRMVLARQLSADDAEASLGQADAFVDWRHPHGRALRGAAWRLGEYLTFYDALYVSLATSLAVPLLTCDRRLAAAPGLPCEVELVAVG